MLTLLSTVLLMQAVPAGAIDLPAERDANATEQASVSSHPEDAGEDILVTGEADDKDKLVCKYEKTTSSRIPKKVCRTQRMIDEQEAQARRELDEGGERQDGKLWRDINRDHE